MPRAISELVKAHPQLADVFEHVLLPFLLPNPAVAKQCYDLVVSELEEVIMEHREQQEEGGEWNGQWQVGDDEAGNDDHDDDDDDAIWAMAEDEDVDAIDSLTPSWIQLCYKVSLLTS